MAEPKKKNLLKYVTAVLSALFLIFLAAWGIVHFNSLKYSASENADNYLGALAASKGAELNGYAELLGSRIERAPVPDDFYETKKVKRKTVRKFLGEEWLKAQTNHFEAETAALYSPEGRLVASRGAGKFEETIAVSQNASRGKQLRFKETDGKFYAELNVRINNYPEESFKAEYLLLNIPVDGTIFKSLKNAPLYFKSEEIFIAAEGTPSYYVDLKAYKLNKIDPASKEEKFSLVIPSNEEELKISTGREGQQTASRMKKVPGLNMSIVTRADVKEIEEFYKPEGIKITIFISAVAFLLAVINFFLFKASKKKTKGSKVSEPIPAGIPAESAGDELDASSIQQKEIVSDEAAVYPGKEEAPMNAGCSSQQENSVTQSELEKIFITAADEAMPMQNREEPVLEEISTAQEESIPDDSASLPDESFIAEAIANESVPEIAEEPEENINDKEGIAGISEDTETSGAENKLPEDELPQLPETVIEPAGNDGMQQFAIEENFPVPGITAKEETAEPVPLPAPEILIEEVPQSEGQTEDEVPEQELVEGTIDYYSTISEPSPYEKPKKEILNRLDSIKGFGLIPKILFEINLLLKNEPDNNQKLASLIVKEHSLTAKLLRTANAPYYGLKKKVTSVEYAIILLGREEIFRLVTALSLSDAVRFPSTNQLRYLDYWHHTMSVGFSSRDIAERLGFKEISNEAFLGGIFHDLGIQILAKYFQKEFEQITEKVISGVNALEAEKTVLGATHQEIGRYSAEKWGLPEMIFDAICFHHNPTASVNAQILSGIINMSDWMTHQVTKRQSFWEGGLELEPSNYKLLGFKSITERNEFLENYYPVLHAAIASIHF